MTDTDRRSARNQALPRDEARILNYLRGFNLYARVRQLYEAGWTLRAIGEAFTPPKPRSTVKSWIDRSDMSLPLHALPPVQPPILVTPATYVPVKPVSPGISPTDLNIITDLAPISRRYRAGMASNHKAAIANRDLTTTVTRLYDSGVPIRELADAAGVTYRAMAKRLGRA